ncbi:unnamed protein product [Cercopithifilaria johnstoni]|uniref:C2H2-type domain-containing protein n=1 Tax=Cercopithifilaria johnstoni TaxID=2874296 RepID=A0A8J2MJD1_9BILA|nr:unnamed protein product [Cercopithifilaria johnstoni]
MQRYSARFLEDLKIAFERAFALQTNLVGQLRCPLCDVRVVGVAAMQKHISEKHGMEMSLESLETFLKDAYEIKTGQSAATLGGSITANLQEQIAIERGEFTCMHCAEIFNDQIQFQLHMIHNHPLVIRTSASGHDMEPLCTRYNFQSSSMADSWIDSEEKHANRSTEEDMKEDETLGDDEHHLVQENRRFFDCPIPWCSRRYRNPIILNKHISIVHQWRLKFSPKNGKNKSRGVISYRNLWKKHYICLFEGCKYRFWSRSDCEKHILCHIGTNNKTGLKGTVVNGSTENGRSQSINKLVRVRDGKIILNVENGNNRKEQERNTHTPNSPDSDIMPEGHGQPSSNRKPYTVQTFLVREQTSQPSSSTNGATTTVGVVFDEMVAHLPVRNTVQEMVRVNVELVPAPLQISPILHL